MTKQRQIDLLYAAYPKKAARRFALKAIANALDREDFDIIMAGVERYAALCAKWKQSNDWHPEIAYPASWFNGDRWADELEDAKGKPNPFLDEPE